MTLVSLNTGLNAPDTTDVTPKFVDGNIPRPLIDLPAPANVRVISGRIAILVTIARRRGSL